MTTLFVSHAWEDKDAFARPLALKLRETFTVWFDEFALKLGQSLREEIDRGLRTCDFGVVILSPAFFDKKWTVDEYNGLRALEEANRKIILPIWLNVTADDVKRFSPTLLDRFAVKASEGIEAVVDKIKIAVGVSERSHEVFAPDPARRAMTSLMNTIRSRELDQRILGSGQGASLFFQSIKNIGQLVWERLSAENSADAQRFVMQPNNRYPWFRGPALLNLRVEPIEAYTNSVLNARLQANFYVGGSRFVGGGAEEQLTKLSWTPTCKTENEIAYRAGIDARVLPESDVASAIIIQWCELIERRLKVVS